MRRTTTTLILAFLASAIVAHAGESIDPDVYEPDDTPAQATPLTLNETQGAHNIDFASPFTEDFDIDFMSFTLAQPATLLLELPNVFGILDVINKLPIALYDATENEIGTAATTRVVSLPAGNFFLSVTSFPAFNVSRIVPWYSAGVFDATLPDRFESNDTQETATYIPYDGKGQAHNFHSDSDVDWFTYSVATNGAAPTTVMAKDINGGLLPLVTVFAERPNGTLEMLTTEVLSNGNNNVGNETATRFFVRVENPQAGRAIADTYYTISVFGTFRLLGAPSPGTVLGAVTSDGQAVNGASVRAASAINVNVSSDQQGIYAFPNLPTQTYSVQAHKSGFLAIATSITVGLGDIIVANFDLDMSARSDLNGDTSVNSIDIQAMINAVLGTGPTADPNNDGSTNASDIQTVINDVLGI